MRNLIAVLAACLLLSGCATLGNVWTEFLGVSTQGIEAARPDAMTKVFEYDYKTCYAKAEALLKRMPRTSIYAKNAGMIAVYVINPNTTPVGLFFTEIDATHTKVEVSSPSTPVKEWVAKNIFTEKVQPLVRPENDIISDDEDGSQDDIVA